MLRSALLALALAAAFLLLSAPAPAHGVSVWLKLADCETGDGDGRPPYRAVWDYNGRSGFDGGLQFLPSTWSMAKQLPEVRGFARRHAFAYQAPAWAQILVAQAWLKRTSWAQWPACARKLGLR